MTASIHAPAAGHSTPSASAVVTGTSLGRRSVFGLTGLALASVALAAAPQAAAAEMQTVQAVEVRARYSADSAIRFRLGAGETVGLTGNVKQVWEGAVRRSYTGITHRLGVGWVYTELLGPVRGLYTQRAVEVMASYRPGADVRYRLPIGEFVGLTGNVYVAWHGAERISFTGVRHALGVGWIRTRDLGAEAPSDMSDDLVRTSTRAAVAVMATYRSGSAVRFRLPSGEPVRLTGASRQVWYGAERISFTGISHALGTGWVRTENLVQTGATPAPAAAPPTTVRFADHTGAGLSSGYHLFADGIDWSRPVGMVTFLHGDYWYDKDSPYKRPDGPILTGLRTEAARRNMVLLVPHTPMPKHPSYGYIWWDRTWRQRNNAWLTHLTQRLYARFPVLDPSLHWGIGYSGGAEFFTYEFFARNPESVMSGGGAVLVAGGGMVADRFPALPSEAFRRSVSLQWYVGDQDGVGSTNPPTWSAYNATAEGEAAYRAVGFTNTSRTVLTGLDHLDYDLPGLLARGLEAGGIARLR